jgi:hypothetical protein
VRNSFGLAFDPITGKLWDTENGPDRYDEINLVLPGFNSGWEQIMGPDALDPQGVGDLFVAPGSHYADPKFSWFNPVGPTAIVFLNSLRLGAEYQNDAFVGDINNGRLYRFKMNQARDGFVLSLPLDDLVADSAGELSQIILGTGFGGITDLKVGPDGILYVLSFGTGKIYAIFGLQIATDFDGDGQSDMSVYQVTNGNWSVVGSSAGFFSPALSFGGSAFVPVVGDYDGDGKTDVAVYQQSTGNWFVVGSSAGFFTPALNFGGFEFIPVVGDYDGDGKTDTAVYQQSTGNWFVVGSSAGFFSLALNFGGSGYIPVPEDYDGDGKIDVAVYQQSTGNWFVVGSSAGFFTPALNFGGTGFLSIPGDYDGDGVTDTAVYQQNTGNWFIDQTSDGFRVNPGFGGSGFVPVLPQVTILRSLGLL